MDFKSFSEVDRLTIPEYNLLMQAVKLKEIDRDYRNHLQAFLNMAVQAQKKKGKNKSEPVYKEFKKFYNYEKAVKEAQKIKEEKEKSVLANFGKKFF